MKESIESIKELGKELERCHKLLLADEEHVLDIPCGLDKGTIESKMHEMQDLLIMLTKRWNGMEY
jgi:hypothetical protein